MNVKILPSDYKQLLDEVFVISRIIKVEVWPKAEADNPYRDLDYSGYHKKPNLIIVLLCIGRSIEGKCLLLH